MSASPPASSRGNPSPPVSTGGMVHPQGGNPAVILQAFEKRLKEYPVIVQASAYVGMRPLVFVGLVGAFLFLSLGFGWGGGLICNLVGFIYPAWLSFKAIESPDKGDDTLLLMYWVVYASFSVVEYFVEIILYWLPFYYLLKLAFLLYLYLPWFKGAEVIYKNFVRPYLITHQDKIDEAVENISAVGVAAADGVSNVVSDGIGLVTQAAGAVRRTAAANQEMNLQS